MDLEKLILDASKLDRINTAHEMGISRMTFWRICNNYQILAPYLAIKTAALFDIPLDALLKEAGYSSKENQELCNFVKKIHFSNSQETKKMI